MLEDEVIWGILVGRLKLYRSLSRSEQVKTLLAGPSPISLMRRRLPTPLFPTHKDHDAGAIDTRKEGVRDQSR